ncbi:hypothetical protein MRX96_005228 [Rhipicephalus microplus]
MTVREAAQNFSETEPIHRGPPQRANCHGRHVWSASEREWTGYLSSPHVLEATRCGHGGQQQGRRSWDRHDPGLRVLAIRPQVQVPIMATARAPNASKHDLVRAFCKGRSRSKRPPRLLTESGSLPLCLLLCLDEPRCLVALDFFHRSGEEEKKRTHS